MPLLLRKNEWHRPERPDYVVVERDDAGERVVGRMYYGAGWNGRMWKYAIYGWGSDLSETRQEAMAALKAHLEALRTSALA